MLIIWNLFHMVDRADQNEKKIKVQNPNVVFIEHAFIWKD